jgi:hypothetical protein
LPVARAHRNQSLIQQRYDVEACAVGREGPCRRCQLIRPGHANAEIRKRCLSVGIGRPSDGAQKSRTSTQNRQCNPHPPHRGAATIQDLNHYRWIDGCSCHGVRWLRDEVDLRGHSAAMYRRRSPNLGCRVVIPVAGLVCVDGAGPGVAMIVTEPALIVQTELLAASTVKVTGNPELEVAATV